jgi:chromosome segregation ATPase
MFHSLTHGQVFQNKRNYSKIDRIDSIERYLETASRNQQKRQAEFMKMQTQNRDFERKFADMKRTMQRLQDENRKLRKDLIKVKAQKTKVIKEDKKGNKTVHEDDPDRAVLLKELNELRLQLKLEKEDADKKLEQFEANIKSMQAIILQNEKNKGRLSP